MQTIIKNIVYLKGYFSFKKPQIGQNQIPLFYFLLGALSKNRDNKDDILILLDILKNCTSLCSQQNRMTSQQFFQILSFLEQHPQKINESHYFFIRMRQLNPDTNYIQSLLDWFYQQQGSTQWKKINKIVSKPQTAETKIDDSKLKDAEINIGDSKPKTAVGTIDSKLKVPETKIVDVKKNTENALIKDNLSEKQEKKAPTYDNSCGPNNRNIAQNKTKESSLHVFEEKISLCPNLSCGYRFSELPNDLTNFQCLQCKRKFCLICRSNSHQGIECFENKMNLSVRIFNQHVNVFGTRKYENYQHCYRSKYNDELKNGLWKFEIGLKYKQCPKCQNWAQYEQSFQKNKKITFFCSLCHYRFCLRCGNDLQYCQCAKLKIQEDQRQKLIKQQQDEQRKKYQQKIISNVRSNLSYNNSKAFNSFTKSQTDQTEKGQQKVVNNSSSMFNPFENPFGADKKKQNQQNIVNKSRVRFDTSENSYKVNQKEKDQQNIFNNSRSMLNPFENPYSTQKSIKNNSTNDNISKKQEIKVPMHQSSHKQNNIKMQQTQQDSSNKRMYQTSYYPNKRIVSQNRRKIPQRNIIMRCSIQITSYCPIPACRYSFDKLPKDLTKFECPQCQISFCLLCKSESHYGLQCIENRRNLKKKQLIEYNRVHSHHRQFDQQVFKKELSSRYYTARSSFKIGDNYIQCPRCLFWTEYTRRLNPANNHFNFCQKCYYVACLKCGDNFNECPCRKNNQLYLQDAKQFLQNKRSRCGGLNHNNFNRNYPIKEQRVKTQQSVQSDKQIRSGFKTLTQQPTIADKVFSENFIRKPKSYQTLSQYLADDQSVSTFKNGKKLDQKQNEKNQGQKLNEKKQDQKPKKQEVAVENNPLRKSLFEPRYNIFHRKTSYSNQHLTEARKPQSFEFRKESGYRPSENIASYKQACDRGKR